MYFVTPLKRNADFQIIAHQKIPVNPKVIKDKIIRFNGFYSQEKCPYDLRLVTVWIEEKNKTLAFVTNNFDLGSTTIAAIYKDRWRIEIFF